MSTAQIEQLFSAHAQDVLAYARRRTDAASADDVVADVFATAWRRADVIPEADPLPWLYAVARRVLANQRRAAGRRAALSDVLGVLARTREPPAPHQSLPVLEALAALSPADRELLMLTAWEGLDAAQVATVLGCSTGAVHTRLHRARRRLEHELQRAGAAPYPTPEAHAP
ncbi:RNA polymerase sigma factor [Paraconexibacter sp. AEG42_29]|uniref:RNA polymerase sigma factor n=1 Tax=Paraconexibacter sp. AEG42_29 TaxID=2997339 RepID=UPI00339D8931